ncbi:GNAT family N-acetyltransferase [Sphaerisporangium fuscum]|uniref:GNAT family N-acetyltransferase n=1 Tax=Sphaerisporangium fuscum TaxID=2835868 RepID=UPI001BDC593E|nr:GNAT family N-acetyltransferase [Sphaerisporangium fuscum]
MTHPPFIATIRPFRHGDGPAIARAWTAAAPGDGITYNRFRDLFLLDRNFDADGLLVAEQDGEIVGAAYGVRRLIPAEGADLEPDSGWIPFFFVVPRARRQGLGSRLVRATMEWLAGNGAKTAYFSSYTPNYFLPGLDAARYPDAARMLASLGFTTQYECVAMDRSLNDYEIPERIRERVAALRADGWSFGSPGGDDLVDLIDIAGGRFNSDWARAIREGVLGGLPLDRIVTVRNPDGAMLGWAMHGTYENVLERFGPFGVLPESRGTGLGEILLHLTLERMRALGAHSAWFLWTDETSPAGHLYLKTGFTVTRTFAVLHAPLAM